jgi:hypothetical protein
MTNRNYRRANPFKGREFHRAMLAVCPGLSLYFFSKQVGPRLGAGRSPRGNVYKFGFWWIKRSLSSS